jgi:2-polyprenyl-6-methoxyphenol hydroxylase-like FAD-dependent oxidoreductase
MNTGIQEACNLGWKLALVVRGFADEALLDTYEIERQPIGRFVLRFTDRAARIATSKAAPSVCCEQSSSRGWHRSCCRLPGRGRTAFARCEIRERPEQAALPPARQ